MVNIKIWKFNSNNLKTSKKIMLLTYKIFKIKQKNSIKKNKYINK